MTSWNCQYDTIQMPNTKRWAKNIQIQSNLYTFFMIIGLFNVWYAFYTHNTLWSHNTPKHLSTWVIFALSSICFNIALTVFSWYDCFSECWCHRVCIHWVQSQPWCLSGVPTSRCKTLLSDALTRHLSARLLSGLEVSWAWPSAMQSTVKWYCWQEDALSRG